MSQSCMHTLSHDNHHIKRPEHNYCPMFFLDDRRDMVTNIALGYFKVDRFKVFFNIRSPCNNVIGQACFVCRTEIFAKYYICTSLELQNNLGENMR